MLGLTGPASAAPASCPPSVALSGPSAIVTEVEKTLTNRALAVGRTGPCGVLEVELRLAGEGIVVIREPSSVDAEARVVADASAAATVIESWARVDLAEPLLAVRAVAARQVFESQRDRPDVGANIPAPRVPTTRVALAASAELGLGLDGSTWTGIAVDGCANVSVMCVGARVRFARDNLTSGDAVDIGGSRTGLDILLTIESTWSAGDWRMRPGFGIGQGVVYGKVPGDDEESAAVLFRGRVALGYQLSKRTSLEFDPAVTFGLGSQRIVIDDQGEPNETAYPGDPGLHFRLGIGLRVEAL